MHEDHKMHARGHEQKVKSNEQESSVSKIKAIKNRESWERHLMRGHRCQQLHRCPHRET